jgi:hypothetical protein
MSKLDDAISETLSKEDAEFLEQFEKEPSAPAQIAGLFSGSLGWINILFVGAAIIVGPFALYAGWKFAMAEEMRALAHWGALAAFGLLLVSIVRILMFLHLQTNRIIREIKRLELQVARLTARTSA